MKLSEINPHKGMKIRLVNVGCWSEHHGHIAVLTRKDGNGWMCECEETEIYINGYDDIEPIEETEKLKVGDRVMTPNGKGTITHIDSGFKPYAVVHDEWTGGHNLGYHGAPICEKGKGRWYEAKELTKLPDEEKVVGVGRNILKDLELKDLCSLPSSGFYLNRIMELIKEYQSYKFNGSPEPKKGIIMSVVNTVKRLALKTTNPEEYELRQAGIHDSDGSITDEGWELAKVHLLELVQEKLVADAKAINEEKKSKKE